MDHFNNSPQHKKFSHKIWDTYNRLGHPDLKIDFGQQSQDLVSSVPADFSFENQLERESRKRQKLEENYPSSSKDMISDFKGEFEKLHTKILQTEKENTTTSDEYKQVVTQFVKFMAEYLNYRAQKEASVFERSLKDSKQLQEAKEISERTSELAYNQVVEDFLSFTRQWAEYEKHYQAGDKNAPTSREKSQAMLQSALETHDQCSNMYHFAKDPLADDRLIDSVSTIVSQVRFYHPEHSIVRTYDQAAEKVWLDLDQRWSKIEEEYESKVGTAAESLYKKIGNSNDEDIVAAYLQKVKNLLQDAKIAERRYAIKDNLAANHLFQHFCQFAHSYLQRLCECTGYEQDLNEYTGKINGFFPDLIRVHDGISTNPFEGINQELAKDLAKIVEDSWTKLQNSKEQLDSGFNDLNNKKGFDHNELLAYKNKAESFIKELKTFGQHLVSRCRAVKADVQFHGLGLDSPVVRQCAKIEECLSKAQKATEQFLDVIHPQSSANIFDQINPSPELIQGHLRIFREGYSEFCDKIPELGEAIKQFDKILVDSPPFKEKQKSKLESMEEVSTTFLETNSNESVLESEEQIDNHMKCFDGLASRLERDPFIQGAYSHYEQLMREPGFDLSQIETAWLVKVRDKHLPRIESIMAEMSQIKGSIESAVNKQLFQISGARPSHLSKMNETIGKYETIRSELYKIKIHLGERKKQLESDGNVHAQHVKDIDNTIEEFILLKATCENIKEQDNLAKIEVEDLLSLHQDLIDLEQKISWNFLDRSEEADQLPPESVGQVKQNAANSAEKFLKEACPISPLSAEAKESLTIVEYAHQKDQQKISEFTMTFQEVKTSVTEFKQNVSDYRAKKASILIEQAEAKYEPAREGVSFVSNYLLLQNFMQEIDEKNLSDFYSFYNFISPTCRGNMETMEEFENANSMYKEKSIISVKNLQDESLTDIGEAIHLMEQADRLRNLSKEMRKKLEEFRHVEDYYRWRGAKFENVGKQETFSDIETYILAFNNRKDSLEKEAMDAISHFLTENPEWQSTHGELKEKYQSTSDEAKILCETVEDYCEPSSLHTSHDTLAYIEEVNEMQIKINAANAEIATRSLASNEDLCSHAYLSNCEQSSALLKELGEKIVNHVKESKKWLRDLNSYEGKLERRLASLQNLLPPAYGQIDDDRVFPPNYEPPPGT